MVQISDFTNEDGTQRWPNDGNFVNIADDGTVAAIRALGRNDDRILLAEQVSWTGIRLRRVPLNADGTVIVNPNGSINWNENWIANNMDDEYRGGVLITRPQFPASGRRNDLVTDLQNFDMHVPTSDELQSNEWCRLLQNDSNQMKIIHKPTLDEWMRKNALKVLESQKTFRSK